jgi:NTP pyrophosphatase (non-canonical NTP hydrolase)
MSQEAAVVEPHDGAGPYSIGSDVWPGLSKLIEECGEVIQVAGKLLGTGGNTTHWDGSDLRVRLQEELADLTAAIAFVGDFCDLDLTAVEGRIDAKYALFEQWHDAQAPVVAAVGLPEEGL